MDNRERAAALILKLAKAIHCIIHDQTDHDVSVGALEEEVKINIMPLLREAGQGKV